MVNWGQFVVCKLLVFTLFIYVSALAQPEMEWSQAYGGDHRETCRQVLQLPDGGFVLGGYRDYFDDTRYDFYVVGTDSAGGEVWSSHFGGNHFEECKEIQQLRDNGFILTGYTYSYGAGGGDGYVVKIDTTGDETWSRTYGGESTDEFVCVLVLNDGCIVHGGFTYSFAEFGSYDAWFVKTDSEGEVIWQNVYGGGSRDLIIDMICTTDGGYLLTGSTRSFGAGGADFYVVKTDSVGEAEWERAYGTELTESCQAAVQTPDGGYALAGFTGERIGPDGPLDPWLVRIDEDGEVLWERTYDWMGYGYHDLFFSMILVEDGGFVCAGAAATLHMYDYYIVRTDEHGETLWFTTYGGNGSETCYSVIRTSDNGYALGGKGYGQGEGLDEFWLVKTEPDPVSVPHLIDPTYPSSFTLYSPYPIPFNSRTIISYDLPVPSPVSVRVLDLSGREVAVLSDGKQIPGHHQLTWTADNCSAGIYFCWLETDYHVYIRKLMLIR